MLTRGLGLPGKVRPPSYWLSGHGLRIQSALRVTFTPVPESSANCFVARLAVGHPREDEHVRLRRKESSSR
jgi:hypothetical protein